MRKLLPEEFQLNATYRNVVVKTRKRVVRLMFAYTLSAPSWNSYTDKQRIAFTYRPTHTVSEPANIPLYITEIFLNVYDASFRSGCTIHT